MQGLDALHDIRHLVLFFILHDRARTDCRRVHPEEVLPFELELIGISLLEHGFFDKGCQVFGAHGGSAHLRRLRSPILNRLDDIPNALLLGAHVDFFHSVSVHFDCVKVFLIIPFDFQIALLYFILDDFVLVLLFVLLDQRDAVFREQLVNQVVRVLFDLLPLLIFYLLLHHLEPLLDQIFEHSPLLLAKVALNEPVALQGTRGRDRLDLVLCLHILEPDVLIWRWDRDGL